MCMYAHTHDHVLVYMCKSMDNPQNPVLSYYHVGPTHRTQICKAKQKAFWLLWARTILLVPESTLLTQCLHRNFYGPVIQIPKCIRSQNTYILKASCAVG